MPALLQVQAAAVLQTADVQTLSVVAHMAFVINAMKVVVVVPTLITQIVV